MRVDLLSCSDCRFLSAIATTTVLSSYNQPAGLRRGKPTRKSVDAKFLCRSSLKNSNGDSRRREVRFSRRLANLICSSLLLLGATNLHEEALAVQQNQLAGRVPGLSPPDENGMRTYRRPDAKSGGHGVGWSPIIPYSFKVPSEWDEVPVSIADLGGTEIDLRFANKKEGNLSVVVAPILRFADTDTDSATIREIGPPERVIYAFGPELIGQNVEGKVKSVQVMQEDGREYYHYELEAPHALVTATAAGNRIYLMTVSANSLQWKKHFPNLKMIADSFRVD